MIDWSTVDTVLLDMDGTLLDLNFDNFFWQQMLPRHYAEKHGLGLDAAQTYLQQRFKAEEGRLAWYCLDFWRRELDIDLLMLKHEIKHLIKVLPHTLDFLRDLRHARKHVMLVTNAHQDSLALKMERTSLSGHFDRIISSHELGFAKEQPEFWECLQRQAPFEAARSVMLDDSLPVLHAARAFGVRYVVAIRQPDSQRPEREIIGFDSIAGFNEIMPVTV